MCSLDVGRVLDDARSERRERLPNACISVLLHLEARLLRHGRVEDVVGRQERDVQEHVGPQREAVHGRVVRRHEDDRVRIGEGHAREVPEREKPAEGEQTQTE